ncbi:MAG TPA: SpoIID/LytB domain-containing protein [Thermoanaerobaculia bacterium]|nr:SpoIID/LytB domain-containing protein [Thermoanaerobaculia bacterium]
MRRGSRWIGAALLLFAAGCASPRGGSGSSGKTAAGPAPPPPALVLPAIPSPALRIGLSSDSAEFTLPAPGAPWIVSGGREPALHAGPLTFRAVGTAAAAFWIQTGAFSEEPVARAQADEMSRRSGYSSSVAFSADKGVYRVRLGPFPDAAAASAAQQKLQAGGVSGIPVTEKSPNAAIAMRDGAGNEEALPGGTVDLAPGAPGLLVEAGGKRYRGNLRLVVNPRGSLNVIDVVNLEDYLRGVVPAEMGPKRFDEIEALKAQAVAARTYALDNRSGFDAEGYDLCATPKCQVYGGVDAEDPLTDLSVEQTRGTIATFQGKPIHALFTSTCGGATEDVRLIFPGMSAAPYLAGVSCGEEDRSTFDGARVPKSAHGKSLTPLEWRGWVLARLAAARGRRGRAGAWDEAFFLAGMKPRASAPESLSPAAVYPAVLSAFGLADDRDVHLTKLDLDNAAGPPDPASMLPSDARAAWATLSRLKVGDGPGLPPPSRSMSEEEFGGLLFSIALRLGGVVETTGRLARRDGGTFVIKTPSGRTSVPAETTVEVARQIDGRLYPASEIALVSGDPVAFWKRGSDVLALWATEVPAGESWEKESSWTEWVRRVSARELALRLAPRAAGSEVRSIDVRRRGRSGRVVEAVVTTDRGSITLAGFDIRQALQLPELLFTVKKTAAPDGSADFVFIGRGWGHGVGLCQNGAYGMALAGAKFDEILRHYYPGVDLGPATPAAPSAAPVPASPPAALSSSPPPGQPVPVQAVPPESPPPPPRPRV